MPIIAKVYFSHPEMALAGVIGSLPDITIRVLQEVSTDPVSDKSFFIMETDQCEVLERELAADHTVKYAQRVSHYEEWPVYGIEFSPKRYFWGPK